MKILYLCPDYGIPVLGSKGASVHIRELIAAFDRAGHSVVLSAPIATRTPWEKPQAVAAEFLHLKTSDTAIPLIQMIDAYTEKLGVNSSLAGEIRRIVYIMEVEPRLTRRFKKSPPDLIYVRASLYATVGAELAREFNCPLVVEVNAPLTAEQATYRDIDLGKLGLDAEKWLLSQADIVLTVSEPLRHHVIEMGADKSRVHVTPNGIDARRFFPAPRNPELRQQLGLAGGPVIGFVGGLRPWHGIESLSELLSKLVPQHPELKLLIVGEGPMQTVLETDLDKRGLSRHVIFTGNRPHNEIPALIREFDIALAPYPPTNHDFYFSPLKLFEYMGCGVPVVAARIGQIPDVIQDGESGLLYTPGNIDELANTCDSLLNNTEQRLLMGQKASSLIHEQYTWDQNAKRVIELVNAL